MNPIGEWIRSCWMLAKPWSILALCALGATCLIAGLFEADSAGWVSLAIAALVGGGAFIDGSRRLSQDKSSQPFAPYEGPLLWTVLSWTLIRLSGSYSGEMLLLGAAVLGWLSVSFPRHVSQAALGLALLLELGLTAGGHQPIAALVIHVAVIAAAVVGLGRFAASEAFRLRLDEARARRRKEADDHERAKDFGLLTAQAPMLGSLPALAENRPTIGRATLDFLDQSFAIQLELLRDAFGLTTAAVLWRTDDGLLLRGVSSHRSDILHGPFPAGLGIPGSVLHGGNAVALTQVHDQFGGLPYYERPGGVGSVLAVMIPDSKGGEPSGVLCIDRSTPGEWSDEERAVLGLVTRKISLDVATGQQLKASDHERTTVRRFCAALGELNGSLGLDQVAEATVGAVGAMVKADLTVITVTREDALKVVLAKGENAAQYKNMELRGEESLVRQSIKLRHTLPVLGQSGRRSSVLSGRDRLENMGSLLVVPLILPQGEPVGALVVTARNENVFDPSARAMLELIAAQVAIKLDLARAHEQIREMATTDALTGLQNRRTFNLATDNMLDRAMRRSDPLCLIMTDIDKFKPLNDTYGHPFGDIVLKGVAQVLGNAVRSVDVAARIGGEEFAIVLESSSAEGGLQLAERIRAEVESLSFTHPEKGQVGVTLSMGIATFPNDADDKETWISRADDALYLAKNSGRNQVRSWPELVKSSVEEFSQVSASH